jgi:hypothetical protein
LDLSMKFSTKTHVVVPQRMLVILICQTQIALYFMNILILFSIFNIIQLIIS